MPAALRGRGLLVAVGFPSAAVVTVGLWLHVHGSEVTASIWAAAILVLLSALGAQMEIVVGPRTRVAPAGAFFIAAALVGGPLVGALAGASSDIFAFGFVWPERTTWAGIRALQGFVVGLVGLHSISSPGQALAATGLAIVLASTVNQGCMVLVLLDRGIGVRAEVSQSWRGIALTWLLSALPVAAFVYLFHSSVPLALALAAGLLLVLYLANRFRLGLEQKLAEERLRSRHDALTGAPNRYALGEALKSEHARIQRGGRPAALCFLDLDLFREVNTDCGYAGGDQLLVSVYRRLRDNLRDSDQAFRWGGEEFVVLAPRTDALELTAFAERLRLLIGEREFPIGDGARRVTCSVGAAIFDEWRSPESSLEVASRLVRVAKQRRNSIEVEARERRGNGMGAVPAVE